MLQDTVKQQFDPIGLFQSLPELYAKVRLVRMIRLPVFVLSFEVFGCACVHVCVCPRASFNVLVQLDVSTCVLQQFIGWL